jgi:hypothetical protein
MFPDGPNKVGMFFKRLSDEESRDNDAVETLKQIYCPLPGTINSHLQQSMPYPLWFVDGPKHYDQANALDVLPKNEERNRVWVWLLDGWSRKEMIKALCLLYSQDNRQAQEIYEICGGA